MHQTFYIDIDEEITSIVDRLRKSKSPEVVIVVPKRAILIQSIVNLKLLKKEAESFKKELVIVTQDKLGKMLIEKAGIEVEQKLDDIDGWEIAESNNFNEIVEEETIEIDRDIVQEKIKRNKKDFDKIGSDGYYQGDANGLVTSPIVYSEKRNEEIFYAEPVQEEMQNEERIINRELVTDVSEELKKQQASYKKNGSKGGLFAPMDMVRNVEIMESSPLKSASDEIVEKKSSQKIFKQEPIVNYQEVFTNEDQEENEVRSRKANDFFENRKPHKQKKEDEYESINVGSRVGKYFFLFTVIAVLAILGSASYLFLPKATINVFVKKKMQSIEAQVDGNSTIGEVDLVNEIVPARAVALNDEISKNFETSGAKDSSNQKSRGTITIYNEFSSSPQPLVATTRFRSADKKIFRLVSAVTVPGMEKVGTENKPGAIEADVIADESGEDYNIGATDFTIPGFESSGGDKFSKIHAKSFKAMIGGGQGSQKIKVVSDSDIESAKNKVAQELKTQITQKLKDSVGSEYVFLEDAIGIDDVIYTSTKSSGDIADNFSITVKAKASAVIFKEVDVKKIAVNLIAKKGEKGVKISENSVNLDFGKADVNLKDGTIIIRVHATGNIVPEVNLDKIKKDLLGKKEAEIEPYIRMQTTDIEKLEVLYWPSFITGKIPAYESRVTISLDSDEALK